MKLLRTLFLSSVLLAAPGLVFAASSRASFQVHITIVSACSAQPTLFGPAAQGQRPIVTCLPGSTPFRTQSSSATQQHEGTDGNFYLVDGTPVPSLFHVADVDLPTHAEVLKTDAKVVYVTF